MALLFACLTPAGLAAQADTTRTCGPSSAAENCVAPPPVAPGGTGGEAEALVLSGGGSRGLAHVGVLRRLEEVGYDPGIVVGTSIGALVAALYAVGYSAEAIEAQVQAVEWGEMFTPAPFVVGPDRSVRYPMATFDRQSDSLRFTRGIIPQWRMNRALVRLLFDAEARSRGDFDQLARRFRAIGTDLRTGDPVVLDRGDLPRAVRASLAVPGVFSPVQWDGLDLVDGGISDNLALHTARTMGGRYLVAVDVGRPTEEVESRGPLAVLGRALDLLQDNAQRDSAPADVTIVPTLPPGASGITFSSDPGPLFELGYDAAVRDGPGIRSTGRAPRAPPPPPERFSALTVEAPDSALAALIRHRFRDVAPGPYDAGSVLTAMDRLYTTGLFEAIWPRVENTDDGVRLVVRAEAPPRLALAGAVGYDSDRAGRAWLSLQRSSSIGLMSTALSLDASFTGVEQWASVGLRGHPPGIAPVVVGAGVHAGLKDVRFAGPENGEVGRAGGWASLEAYRLLSERVAVLLLRGEHLWAPAGGRGWGFGPMLRVSAPQSERPVVGLPAGVEAEIRWGDYHYRRAALQGGRTFGIGPMMGAVLADVSAVWGRPPPDAVPALGDDYLVPGYGWGEGRGRARMIAGADLAIPAMTGGHLRLRVRSGAAGEGLEQVLRRGEWAVGSELGIVYRSPFGALSLGVGANTRSGPRVVLDLGADF